ncbi:hypothetical protein B0H19DRAFT_1256115 [Mycena capillaripes]|nr:hypothetical protein B0H19DRAFT_1256115 [Mycena capillaripes]
MPCDTDNESAEQFHQCLLSMGPTEAEDQLSADDFTLQSTLVAECKKAEAIWKAEEERALEVERPHKAAEAVQKKKEKKEVKKRQEEEEKKRQEEEEKRKAGEKGKGKEVGPSGAAKRGRPIGAGGDSGDEGDKEEESSMPKKKKAKQCNLCEKKGIPCLRPESNKGHACRVCYTSKIKCSLGSGGAVSGIASAAEIVDTLFRFEQEYATHNQVMEENERKMRELVRVNQNRMEAAIGQLTVEVHTLARAVTELGRLAAAYTRVRFPDMIESYHEDLDAEKKEKGKGERVRGRGPWRGAKRGHLGYGGRSGPKE